VWDRSLHSGLPKDMFEVKRTGDTPTTAKVGHSLAALLFSLIGLREAGNCMMEERSWNRPWHRQPLALI
jgi:hypothetical protein